jgi:hypothetical protein
LEQRDQSKLQRELLESGDLEGAARVTGHIVDRRLVHSGVIDDFETLAGVSSDVIVGSVDIGLSEFVPGNSYVTSKYTFSVEDVLKGELQKGASVRLELLGGRTSFPGGTWAETKLVSFRMPIRNERFLVFAAPTELVVPVESGESFDRSPVLSPVSYRCGILAIDEFGRIKARAEYAGIARRSVGVRIQEVFASVREAEKNIE